MLYYSNYCFTRRLNNPTSGKQDVEEHFICPIKAATFFCQGNFQSHQQATTVAAVEPDNTCILRLMGVYREIIYQGGVFIIPIHSYFSIGLRTKEVVVQANLHETDLLLQYLSHYLT